MLCRRHIGDIVGAASCPEQELQCFIDHLTNFNSSIKYTYAISNKTVTFLNIQLKIDCNHIKSCAHFMHTEKHNYLLFSSRHPPSCMQSNQFSQLLRVKRCCSDNVVIAISNQVANYFYARQCPSILLKQPTKIFTQFTERIFLCHLQRGFSGSYSFNSSIPPFNLPVTSHHSEALQNSFV